MSLTTPTVHLPQATISIPSWARRHLSWLLVGLAVIAAAVLVTVALAGGGSSSRTVTSPFIERGSISAIDHRMQAGATPVLQDRSVAAVDHADAGG